MGVVKYIVVCTCGGEPKAVALIDDCRPVGVTIRGIGEEDTQVVFAAAGEQRVAQWWAERSVTETIWEDGHSTWAIRCTACGQQVQFADKNLPGIADELAAPVDACPLIPSLSEGGDAQRHMIPLGVLTRILSR
jgi:hypothetical protein